MYKVELNTSTKKLKCEDMGNGRINMLLLNYNTHIQFGRWALIAWTRHSSVFMWPCNIILSWKLCVCLNAQTVHDMCTQLMLVINLCCLLKFNKNERDKRAMPFKPLEFKSLEFTMFSTQPTLHILHALSLTTMLSHVKDEFVRFNLHIKTKHGSDEEHIVNRFYHMYPKGTMKPKIGYPH